MGSASGAASLRRFCVGAAHSEAGVPGGAPLGVWDILRAPHCHVSVFVLPPGSGIPLHDHRHMHVLSTLLTGQLRVLSATPGAALARAEAPATHAQGDTWALSPGRGNVHAFECAPDAAAPATVLEVLAPPYAPEAPCTYFGAAPAAGGAPLEDLPPPGEHFALRPLAGAPAGLAMVGL